MTDRDDARAALDQLAEHDPANAATVGRYLEHLEDLNNHLAQHSAAAGKVLELHQPVTDGMGFTEDGYGGISPACSSCGTSDEYAVPYPCPTVTAITTALEATK